MKCPSPAQAPMLYFYCAHTIRIRVRACNMTLSNRSGSPSLPLTFSFLEGPSFAINHSVASCCTLMNVSPQQVITTRRSTRAFRASGSCRSLARFSPLMQLCNERTDGRTIEQKWERGSLMAHRYCAIASYGTYTIGGESSVRRRGKDTVR